jgi:23S rRNA (guanosine2251-2'-O)-methyltransferase
VTRDAEPTELIYGVHPVLEALASGRRTIDRILVARGGQAQALGRVLRAARDADVPISHLPREVLAKKAGAKAVHQGVAAIVSPIPYATAEQLVQALAADPLGGVVVLDGVEDPRNLGAVIRSAAGAGCGGVLLGTEASVGLTPVAVKASAGTAERVPVARDSRIPARLREMASVGATVLGLDARGGSAWDTLDLSGRVVLVAGGEERGLRRGVLDACHHRVAIPLAAGVESLNVSVAVAVVLFEAVRQRRRARRL